MRILFPGAGAARLSGSTPFLREAGEDFFAAPLVDLVQCRPPRAVATPRSLCMTSWEAPVFFEVAPLREPA